MNKDKGGQDSTTPYAQSTTIKGLSNAVIHAAIKKGIGIEGISAERSNCQPTTLAVKGEDVSCIFINPLLLTKPCFYCFENRSSCDCEPMTAGGNHGSNFK